MKNGCNEHLEAKIAEHDERAKKIYRYVNDVSRRIGEATASCVNVSDLFKTNIEALRQKLRENCEKLFFCDPLNYGKKSLELLWRKVYYDTVCTAKKLRETNNEFDGYLFTHIMSGIGHFHHIITRIECEMKIKINELDYMPLDIDEEVGGGDQKLDEEGQHFARSSLFNCLIYLGDLSRYQVEIFNTFDPSTAVRYYLQAAQIDLCSGMPYNQLGNLFLDKNYNLDSVCYYIHCLSSISPFEGAIGNLTKIFEKNHQFLETINDSESCTQTEHIQNTIAEFLSLTEIWYLGKEDANVSKLCGNIAQKLKIGIDFHVSVLPDINKNYVEYSQAIEEEQSNPSFINFNMIHNIVEICLFINAKLAEIDEPQAFACKAFTFAFLSQLLQKLHKHLGSLGLKSPAYQFKPKLYFRPSKENDHVTDNETKNIETSLISNGNENNTNDTQLKKDLSDEEESKPPNGDSKSSKKALTKRRRRRKVVSSESSDVSDEDTESSEIQTDKSESENEDQLSDSTYVSEDDSQSEDSVDEEIDDKNVPMNGISHNEIIIESKESVNNSVPLLISGNEKGVNQAENNVENKFDIQGIQNFLMGNNFMASIKLLQDWVLTEKDLILSCGESGESLFQCVVDLLNIFLYYFNSKTQNQLPKGNCKIFEYAKAVAKKLKLEYKTIPLPEDINLRGTNICKFDKDAAEWQLLEKYKPSVYEENIIRMLNFIDFGYQIAKIVPRIRFNRTMKIFYLKKLLPTRISTKVNHKKGREWHNSKKPLEAREGGLLRRLGRLWLVSQVKELENTRHTPVPSLLALDTAALYKHLKRVKQLLRTRNFVFLVPNVVLQELDELKRECSSARDAIRWLEIQLKSGSRFLRTQRPGQSRPLPFLKYPRKSPAQVHNFVQILEFCNHFIEDEKQNHGGGNGDSDSVHGKTASLLILLVGNELVNNEEQFKDFSMTGAAHSAGISVEYIGDFYAKWRQTIHKSGKKR